MSRRPRFAAPLAGALLLLGLFGARPSRGDGVCATNGYVDLARTSLTGTLKVDRGSGPSIGVGLPYGSYVSSSDMSGWSPTGRGDAVDVEIQLVEGGSDRTTIEIGCRRASFAALSTGTAQPLKALCGAVASDAGLSAVDPTAPLASLRVYGSYAPPGLASRAVWLVFDLATLDATATGSASLDANGDGTATFALTLPDATLTTTAVLDADSRLPIADAPPVTLRLFASTLNGYTRFAPRSDACPPSGGGCDCGGPAGGWRPGGG